ncbi:MAG: SCO family protein [Anaerolineales bacterium]|nr:SCO family protein [Anaerolineales bacterium]
MNKNTRLFFTTGLIMGIALAFVWGLARLQPYTYHGTVLQTPIPAYDFKLQASQGQNLRLSDFKDQVVLLYFGYTFCPDVCPATLSELAAAREILGQAADQVQVIMISVDPERDTPQVLAEYVQYFDSSFIGLTGTPQQIQQVASQYGIFYQAQQGTAATGYLVDHTASVLVIDRQGQLRLILPFETEAPDIASDIEQLLK